MNVSATLKYARISSQKARLVADQIRGLGVERASELLEFSSKKAAKLIKKVVDSAIANAENNEGADIDELRVSRIHVNDGPVAKRIRARARGRACRILKRTCHITVEVSDKESEII